MTLTATQYAQLAGICQQWCERSISTKPVDKGKAEFGCKRIYTALKLPIPAMIWCDSPFIASAAYQLTSCGQNVPTNLTVQRMRSLNQAMEAVADSKVKPSSTIGLQTLCEDLYGKLVTRGVASVNDSYQYASSILDSYLRHRNQFIDQYVLSALFNCFTSRPVDKFFLRFMTGLHYPHLDHLTVADFWMQHSDLDGLHTLVSAGVNQLIFTHTICFLCEAPIKYHVNEQHLLHCDGDAAMEWKDGFAIYALNGIAVSKAIAVTPAEKMSPVYVLLTHGGMTLREIIRKIGVERMLPHLPVKKLQARGKYELLSVDFPGLLQDARYLKMINPSTGTYHVEGVTRDADTINKALLERNQGWFTHADKLT